MSSGPETRSVRAGWRGGLSQLCDLALLRRERVDIVEGRQPATLTARTLQDIDLPLAWADQRALLGFG